MGMDHEHHRRVGPPDPEALKRLKGYEAREREGDALRTAGYSSDLGPNR